MRLLQPRADGPLSTLRRYFGHQTMWYFTENTVLFVDPRTASLNGPARTGRRLRRPGRLDPRLKPWATAPIWSPARVVPVG